MARTVTLVDTAGTKLGMADLVEAHTGQGKLHKAFSVYVFRSNRLEMLIQRRSGKKMLWPLTWANTCCSHPFEDEAAAAAGERRLREELGFSCPLVPVSDFVYRAEDPAGRGVEHEHVTILVGDDPAGEIDADPNEVEECRWVPVQELLAEMEKNAEEYAPWFHQGLRIILESPVA